MNALLSAWWRNKHTSGAAVGIALFTVASIWLPQYKSKLDETARVLIVYGLLAAGDASASVKKSDASKESSGEKEKS